MKTSPIHLAALSQGNVAVRTHVCSLYFCALFTRQCGVPWGIVGHCYSSIISINSRTCDFSVCPFVFSVYHLTIFCVSNRDQKEIEAAFEARKAEQRQREAEERRKKREEEAAKRDAGDKKPAAARGGKAGEGAKDSSDWRADAKPPEPKAKREPREDRPPRDNKEPRDNKDRRDHKDGEGKGERRDHKDGDKGERKERRPPREGDHPKDRSEGGRKDAVPPHASAKAPAAAPAAKEDKAEKAKPKVEPKKAEVPKKPAKPVNLFDLLGDANE
jgi:hypothetical protein